MISLFKKKYVEDGVSFLSNRHPLIKKLRDKYGYPFLEPLKGSFFLALVRSIIFQQISTNVASIIYKRFKKLYIPIIITPALVLKTNDSLFKSIGLSKRKIEYIKAVAHFFILTDYTDEDFYLMQDDEIKQELINIRGIGSWSIDMLLIFYLGRPDVFPVRDLAIRNGCNIIFNTKDNQDKMINEALKWKPYRSILSWYLWRVVADSC